MSVVPLSELGLSLTIAQVQAAAQVGAAAAIVAACAPGGAIYTLLNPANNGPFASGALSGLPAYTLFAAVPNSYAVLSGFIVITDAPVLLQIRNTGGVTLGDPFSCAPGAPVVVAPTSRQSYQSNADEGLEITCDDPLASLNLSYWGGYF